MQITDEMFFEGIKAGVQQAMKECELNIGMTLKEAVEKQVPRKPKIILHGTTDYNTKSVCPPCGAMVRPCDNYCNKCGQKLDWSRWIKK